MIRLKVSDDVSKARHADWLTLFMSYLFYKSFVSCTASDPCYYFLVFHLLHRIFNLSIRLFSSESVWLLLFNLSPFTVTGFCLFQSIYSICFISHLWSLQEKDQKTNQEIDGMSIGFSICTVTLAVVYCDPIKLWCFLQDINHTTSWQI